MTSDHQSTLDPKRIWSLINGKRKEDINNVIMSYLFNHFKKLNGGTNENILRVPDDFGYAYLYRPIILEEVQEIIVKFKNHKAAGFNGVTNEHIKHSFEKIGGIFPEIWLLGIIKSIYKKKCL